MNIPRALITIGAVALCSCATQEPSDISLLQYVDPFIGTGGHGHTFPGATTPFGMVQLSPDTRLFGWDASSGYHYSDSTIHGFSHTHLSGTGIGDMGDILFLPYTGEERDSLLAFFDKETESASPGYYRVHLKNYDVTAELTASPRVGVHRYTFPDTSGQKLLIDLGHLLQSDWGHKSTGGALQFLDDQTIQGERTSSGWAFDHKVYFYARFSSPFKVLSLKNGIDRLAGTDITGKDLRAWLEFTENTSATVVIDVGISPVSLEGARKNLEDEVPDTNFDRVRQQAESAWERELSSIIAESGDEALLRNFYTALYHTMIAPMLHQDADGKYRGMDKQIHQAEPGFTNYTVFSLWDTFRAWFPLMTMINKERAEGWITSLLRKYEEGGVLPKWPLASNYTGTMVGYPAVALMADAAGKGMTNFNMDLALEAAVFSSTFHPQFQFVEPRGEQVLPPHLKYIAERGFIPADSVSWSVSYGLECAYYDWCISRIATIAQNDRVRDKYLQRSKFYKNYFDPSVGFMRGKLADQSWREPFSPFESDFYGDFIEGNAWQWSWFVPHDVKELIRMAGGADAFNDKLDELFSASSTLEGEEIPEDISGLIGQYAHGNEPSHHVAHLYNFIGRPWKTQERIDTILHALYHPAPDGIPGNEDCGQMSAWYVLNAIGFYQVCPGEPVYSIGRPLFDKVTIHLPEGGTFCVVTENNSRENKYIREMYLDGERLETPFFDHSRIRDKGILKIIMTRQPDTL